MFNNVYCHLTICITATVTANCAEIGDYAAGSDPMLNSVLNEDWSYSVPGRQFQKGTVAVMSPLLYRECLIFLRSYITY